MRLCLVAELTNKVIKLLLSSKKNVEVGWFWCCELQLVT